MTTYSGTDEFEGATFTRTSFKGATIRFSDVSGVTMRSVDVDGLDVDSHDLLQGRRELWIEHGEEMYRLRLTRAGKLYLTK